MAAANEAAPQHPVTAWLGRAPAVVFSGWAIVAAFTTYFCMYAFRKPFAVGTYEGQVALGPLPPMDLKILFLIAQVIGYCASKFIGIKVISEMTGGRRALAILAAIGIAEGALALFAVLPTPWNALAMLINGLPLGMVWGLIFGYLEGRRVSEVLGAGLSMSYIVASGAVKSVGSYVMEAGVPERWMPAVTGLLFVAPMLVVVWMLKILPPPSAEDEALRVKREPMDARARNAFLLRFFPGLAALTGLYILLTAYRDFRDDFAREIWDAVGYAGTPSVFALSEIPVGFGVMIGLGLVMLIKDNRRALMVIHLMMAAGSALIGLATLGFQAGVLPAAAWMVLVGLGLYLAYVPYGCVLFDRLIAAVGIVATAGFMIYVTDAFGYLGSVALLLVKSFGQPDLSWLDFFVGFSYATSVVCTALFVASFVYFGHRTSPRPSRRGVPAS